MKCAEIEQSIQSLIDNELELPKRKQLKEHLADCRLCYQNFADLHQIKQHLQIQPQILPNNSFDRQMLKTFENHPKFQKKSSWFVSIFAIPKPALAFAVGLFVLGVSFSFLLGRISVSSNPVTEKTEQIEPKFIEVEPKEKIVKEIKYVTKYVEVPIVKEKIVYINRIVKNIPQKENLARQATKDQTKELPKQLRLEDFQIVKNINYQIIRGETINE